MEKTMDNTAYLEYVKPTVTGGELSQLQDLAEQQAEAEAKVARIQAELTAAQEELKDLAERQIPTLMDEIGISEFKTRSGLQIAIAETIRASIPKARTGEAYAWLRANGHAALIKRVVSVAFGKGEDGEAEELLKELQEANLPADDVTSIHSSTLTAWVREKLRDGAEIPLDLFGVFRQRSSKIELPKQ